MQIMLDRHVHQLNVHACMQSKMVLCMHAHKRYFACMHITLCMHEDVYIIRHVHHFDVHACLQSKMMLCIHAHVYIIYMSIHGMRNIQNTSIQKKKSREYEYVETRECTVSSPHTLLLRERRRELCNRQHHTATLQHTTSCYNTL